MAHASAAVPSFDTYISLEVAYVNRCSIWLDAKILARAMSVVMSGQGSKELTRLLAERYREALLSTHAVSADPRPSWPNAVARKTIACTRQMSEAGRCESQFS